MNNKGMMLEQRENTEKLRRNEIKIEIKEWKTEHQKAYNKKKYYIYKK